MNCDEIIVKLKFHANPKNVAGMKRYGINSRNMLGVSIPFLRALAKEIGKNHNLALELWDSEIHEAQILAGLTDDPKQVSEKQMSSWVKDFDSWGICDQVCSNLFDKTPFAYEKAVEWTKVESEYIKRAGFVLMACLSVHDKQAIDSQFESFFPIITRESTDERNFVRKAVNWALRQIGKRNRYLNRKAIRQAEQISRIDSKSARWIAADALRELSGPVVKRKLGLH